MYKLIFYFSKYLNKEKQIKKYEKLHNEPVKLQLKPRYTCQITKIKHYHAQIPKIGINSYG